MLVFIMPDLLYRCFCYEKNTIIVYAIHHYRTDII
jgi:hypothetical protein